MRVSIKRDQMLECRSVVTLLVTAMQSSIQLSMSAVNAALWRCSAHNMHIMYNVLSNEA